MQKIKGLFKVILTAVLMLMLLPATALAAVDDTFIIGGIKYKVLTETGSTGTVEVIENSPRYSGDINIPETVVNSGITYTVTSIGNFAFIFCQDLKSISLPDSVTAIGNTAFFQCTSLTNINIPNSVTSIGDDAFASCIALTSISLPDGLTSIGNGAFANCHVLTSISLPDGLTSIGDGAFSACFVLTSVTFSGSTPPSFGVNMFNGAWEFSQVIVPHGAASAYAAALAGKLPPSAVIKEKEPAVITITAISGVTVPASGAVPVTTITEAEQYTGTVTWAPADNPFAASKDYTATITLTPKAGYTLTGVAANFFTVAGATSVGNEADSGVITAIFPATEDTFITDGINYKVLTQTENFGTVQVLKDVENPYRGNINIPETVVNGGVTYTVTSIGDAFEWCSLLTSVSLPDSVTAIGEKAFYYCGSLTSINIPDSVNSIGASAFFYCSGLTSINIPDNVTSIGVSAFANCRSLTSINIPDSVTAIEDNAFWGCISLTSIAFSGNTPPSFGANMFYGVPAGLQVIVPHGAASAYATALAGKLPPNAVIKEKEPAVITITAISGVTAPASGAVPVTTITETEQYTGTVTWAPADNPFATSRDYTATITLTPKAGYTLIGVAANFFTIAGATSVSNEAGSGVISATFPITDEDGCLVTYQGAQARHNEGSNTYDIRFVATIDILEAKEVGFVFSKSETIPTRGNENASEKATSTVYTDITALGKTVTAESLGGEYIIACTVTGIPAADSEVKLHVRAFSTVGTETKYTSVRTVTVSELLGE